MKAALYVTVIVLALLGAWFDFAGDSRGMRMFSIATACAGAFGLGMMLAEWTATR